VGTPGGAAGAAAGNSNSLLLGKCGFWNPLVGLKVLQKLTDALAAAEEEDLAKAPAPSKQNSSSRGSSRRNSKEPFSPTKEPLSPKTSKEPLSPKKEPLSPTSPATAASGKSSWTPKTKGAAFAGQTGNGAAGNHHNHPVQFIYAQTVSFSETHSVHAIFSDDCTATFSFFHIYFFFREYDVLPYSPLPYTSLPTAACNGQKARQEVSGTGEVREKVGPINP